MTSWRIAGILALAPLMAQPDVFKCQPAGPKGTDKTLQTILWFRRRTWIPLLVASLCWIAVPAEAEIYKCSDNAGKVQLSDMPCASGTVGGKVQVKPNVLDSSEGRALEARQSLELQRQLEQARNTAPAPVPAQDSTVRKAQEIGSADRLAALCVDAYRPHLAYPQGVKVLSRTLEKSLSEWQITVQVQTITNNHTPTRIDPIVLREKFICVTDGGNGLNARSTSMYVDRHKGGQQL